MRASRLLDEIGKFYIPGVVAYYDQSPVSPWSKAMDEYEAVLVSSQDWEVIEKAGQKCLQQARALVEHYKKHSPPAQLTMEDAFILGDEQRVKDWQSAQRSECYLCGEKAGLHLEPGEEGRVRVVCTEHKRLAS